MARLAGAVEFPPPPPLPIRRALPVIQSPGLTSALAIGEEVVRALAG